MFLFAAWLLDFGVKGLSVYNKAVEYGFPFFSLSPILSLYAHEHEQQCCPQCDKRISFLENGKRKAVVICLFDTP